MPDLLAMIAGATLVVLAWLSVLRTVFAPGQSPPRMPRWTARMVAAVLIPVGGRLPAERRERLLALCAPLALFATFGGWFLGMAAGFLLLGAATETRVTTPANPLGAVALMSCVLLVGVFVVHLIRVTNAYSRRELLVSRLSAQAASAPDAERVIATYVRSDSRSQLDTWFAEWAGWLADIRCTHVGYPSLVYYRPANELCWLEAAVIVLDAAALVESAAPGWAPPNTRALLDTGGGCLGLLAAEMGITLPRSTVSLHYREQHGFADTMRLTTFAGLPAERSQRVAWQVFQSERTRYAPYAAAIAARLRYDPGRVAPARAATAKEFGG